MASGTKSQAILKVPFVAAALGAAFSPEHSAKFSCAVHDDHEFNPLLRERWFGREKKMKCDPYRAVKFMRNVGENVDPNT